MFGVVAAWGKYFGGHTNVPTIAWHANRTMWNFGHNTIVRKTVNVDAGNFHFVSVEFKHQSHSLIFMSMEANMMLLE
jgi:hypothetical protein